MHNNFLRIYGGTIIGNIYGGYSLFTDVYGNTIVVSDWDYNSDYSPISIYGGYSSSGAVYNNSIEISDAEDSELSSTVQNIYGGYSTSGDVHNNTITLNSNNLSISGSVYGGQSESGGVYGNTLNIYGGNYTDSIYGGYSIVGYANDNILNITDGTITSDYLGGGWGNLSSSGNQLNISGGDITVSENIYAGRSGSSDATGNTLTISGGTINTSGFLAGAWSGGSTSNNTVNISGGTIIGSIFASVSSINSSSTDNVINISGTPNLSSTWIFGYNPSDAGNPSHSGNTLNIYTKDITALNISSFDNINFYLDSNTSNGDTILTLTSGETDLSSTDIQAVVQGGSSLTEGDAVTLLTNSNGVTDAQSYTGTLQEGVSLIHSLNVYRDDEGNSIIAQIGGVSDPIHDTNTSSASNNTVTVNESTYTINDGEEISYSGVNNVYGGITTSESTTDSDIVGGSDSLGAAFNNAVNIKGGEISGNVYGGFALATDEEENSNASENLVTIDNGAIEGEVLGGFAYMGSVTNNTITVNDGTISENVYGGLVSIGNANENTLTINGGTFGGDIYGGYTYSAQDANNNTINIYNNPNLVSSNLYGGYSDNGTVSGNTLNIYTKDLSVNNIYNFENLNFYIPNNVVNGDTMLTLISSEGTDLSNTTINAGVIEGNSNLAEGDTINLLTNSNGLITTSGTTYGTLTRGVSLDYELTVSNSGNSITAHIDSIAGLNPKVDSLPISGMSGVQAVDNSLDMKTLPDSATSSGDSESSTDETTSQGTSNVQIVEPRGYEIFANMGGGSFRTKSGNGSYVDMTSQNINLGFARSFAQSAGRFTIAPIIDYAHGNYDSYLIDGTHGSGSTRYIAGGLIARRMLSNGFYYETSVRLGKVKTDFASGDLDSTGVFGTVTYDTSATTLAGHLKLGKAVRLNKNNLIDVYAIYSHAHQGSMNADLSSGEHYDFSSADSGRFRIGYRLTTRTSRISQIYTGLAYQYENSSGITAKYKGYETQSAGENGSSGMLEVGWLVKPFKSVPWAVDINTTGWTGHQRGVTAMAKISKFF